jgi:hypothetical protein
MFGRERFLGPLAAEATKAGVLPLGTSHGASHGFAISLMWGHARFDLQCECETPRLVFREDGRRASRTYADYRD